MRILMDNLVLLVVCFVSLILPIFEMNLFRNMISEGWTLPIYAVLFFVNAIVLMWLWKRFGPTAGGSGKGGHDG